MIEGEGRIDRNKDAGRERKKHGKIKAYRDKVRK